MALVIRLRKQGRTNRQCFRLVAIDSRTSRDGKYVDKLGWYDPKSGTGKNLVIDAEKVKHWLDLGAKLSERAESLLAKSAPEVLKMLKARQKKKSEKKRLQRKKTKTKKTSVEKPSVKKKTVKTAKKK